MQNSQDPNNIFIDNDVLNEDNEIKESEESDFDDTNENEDEIIINAIKRKINDSNNEKEENNSKKVHKSLKDNPRPFATPALRKKKENELQYKPNKPTKNQILPAILAQPNINKE